MDGGELRGWPCENEHFSGGEQNVAGHDAPDEARAGAPALELADVLQGDLHGGREGVGVEARPAAPLAWERLQVRSADAHKLVVVPTTEDCVLVARVKFLRPQCRAFEKQHQCPTLDPTTVEGPA